MSERRLPDRKERGIVCQGKKKSAVAVAALARWLRMTIKLSLFSVRHDI
jgi:hypothetical protein